MFDDYKGIPREAMLLVYSTVLPSLAFGMFYTDISYFLNIVQSIDIVFVGTLIMIMGLASVALSIPLGMLADRYGRKKMLVLGNVVESMIIAMFALTTDPVMLVGIALLSGLGEACFAAASSALLADKAGDSKRTAAFSLMGFISGIAFGLGSFAIPVVSVFEWVGFNTQEAHIILYVVLAALSFVSTVFILMVKECRPECKQGQGIKAYLPRKSKDILIKYTVSGFIIAFGAGLFVPLMTNWFEFAYGISDKISGPILGVSNLLIGVTTLAVPVLAKRLGIIKAIVTTQALSTIFMVATPLSPNFIIASSAYTVRTFLMNMANPMQQSMIMGLVAKDERGAASGISSALWRLPNSVSTMIGSWLMGMGFLAMPFYLGAVLYSLSIIIFWIFFRRVQLPEESLNAEQHG